MLLVQEPRHHASLVFIRYYCKNNLAGGPNARGWQNYNSNSNAENFQNLIHSKISYIENKKVK
jgi:hypothetical protein